MSQSRILLVDDRLVMIKGSRINNFTELAVRFSLGLVDFKEQKAQ